MDRIFPHIVDAADIAGPGPSPWTVCSRPSCRLMYRTLACTRVVTPPCPMCGQTFIPARHGPALTKVQREMM